MTAPLDFGLRPPEINSALVYSGAGPSPMLAAAASWHTLAAELRCSAVSYGSVLTALTGEEWLGPASSAMAAAVMPYAAWLSATAELAEQTAAQAEAAVAAYEAVFSATVPPPAVAANRARLATLVATNVLGQNTPAIAATEAEYAEMWSQDAAAMYGYAGASAAATRLTGFTGPQQTTAPGGLARQSAAVAQAATTSAGTQQAALSRLTAALPSALQSLAAPAATTTSSATSGTGFSDFLNSNFLNTLASTGAFNPVQVVQAVTSSSLLGTTGATGDAAAGLGQAIATPAGGAGSVGSSVSVSLGRSSLIGPLAVPPGWAGPAPLASALPSTLGGTPMIAPSSAASAASPAAAGGMPGMPGLPLAGPGGQGYGRALPQYGFRPRFVAHPPAAG